MAANQDRDIITVTFETLAQGGEALAREESGRVVFVPYAIAGETARVAITESRRGFARGRIIELVQASPSRITPLCPHFPPSPVAALGNEDVKYCGGCQWQHM
jgi:23S rRNA (uracil1939-C5)-methyltransferase